MKTKFLLPYRWKKIGWFLLIPATIIGIIRSFTENQPEWLNLKAFALYSNPLFSDPVYFGFIKTNLTDTLIGSFFLIGALITGFSKEKVEDEFIADTRLSALLWAVIVNYSLLLFAFLFIYGTIFLNIIIYNMFTVLLLFIFRFHYILYKYSKKMPYEK